MVTKTKKNPATRPTKAKTTPAKAKTTPTKAKTKAKPAEKAATPAEKAATAAEKAATPAEKAAGPAKKAATPAKKAATPAKKAATPAKTANPFKKAMMKIFGTRADLGAPIDDFFARQPEIMKPITDALRSLIDEAAPDAESRIKWGMPFFDLAGTTFVAIGAHKAHVNVILPGPPGTFADPNGLLVGEGKTGQLLKIRSLDGLPTEEVRGWLKTAVARARKG